MYKRQFYTLVEVGFFLAFLMLMVIILFNLLNGLAVKDTETMLEDAEVAMLYQLLGTAAFWDSKTFVRKHISVLGGNTTVYFPTLKKKLQNKADYLVKKSKLQKDKEETPENSSMQKGDEEENTCYAMPVSKIFSMIFHSFLDVRNHFRKLWIIPVSYTHLTLPTKA